MHSDRDRWILGAFGAFLYIVAYVFIAFTELRALWIDLIFIFILTPCFGISVGLLVTAYEEIRFGTSKWRVIREKVHKSFEESYERKKEKKKSNLLMRNKK